MTRLFHFSDDPGIAAFEPRPVRVPSVRPPGQDWLNGPLVWAIDDWHQPLYLFPRECPRILAWPLATTSPGDRARHFGVRACHMRAWIERGWADRLAAARLWRYEFSADGFESSGDAGMHVARRAVRPIARERIGDLDAVLTAADVVLETVDSLMPLKPLWQTSLHVSGIRLRNAKGWTA